MPKAKEKYPEISDIRQDLDSLKTNVVELTKHLKKDGSTQTKALKKSVLARIAEMQKSGQMQYKNVEKHVKAKPAQSMAIAFAAGLALSALMRRR